jgi:hypothetical protein
MVGDLAWPVAILIIAIVVLASQREPVGRLIDRLKKVKYPGGEAELAVPESGAESIRTLVDALSRDVSERVDREEAPPAGDAPMEPTHNREPLGDFEPLPTGQVSDAVMLRTKAANLLSELAFPPPPGGFGPVSATIDVLHSRGVLDAEQAQALRDAVGIGDQAAGGAAVPQRVTLACQNSGPAILDQLALLQTVAAARFEDYVLDTLRQRLPAGWSMDIDRALPRNENAPGGLHARVDALVTAGDQRAVVEVRARLQPGSQGQVEVVADWLRALPPDLPVLIVMLGEGLTARELRQIGDGHEAAVEVLQWDLDADALIVVLRELLERSEVLQPG